jgi:uncharacterized protein (TIGR00369 family)
MTELLRAVAEETPYHRSLGVRVEVLERDRVRLRVPYKDENSNPGRALHGGVAASLIDIAGVLAARSGIEDGAGLRSTTLDLTVAYLAAAIGEDVVADARVLRRGKEIVYAEVDVANDAGKRIAKGLVTHRLAPPPRPDREQALPPESLPAATADVPPMARALVAVPFIARRGMRIVYMCDGCAVVEMPFSAHNADHEGAVHEGPLAALLDTTGAMAAWSLVGLDLRLKASTVGVHVSFHAPAREEGVTAEGRTLRRLDESFLNTVSVRGQASQRIVATGSVTYRIVVPR